MNRREAVLGAVARGWCSKKNENKVMDIDLAEAIVDEVLRAEMTIADDLIIEALKNLNSGQISIIKDGIEQNGGIGHYGRHFIANAITDSLIKENVEVTNG